MQRAAFLVLMLLALSAQGRADSTSVDPYKVLPLEDEFADQSIMLLKHLARTTQERAWQREVELARIRSEKDWLAYKTKLLNNYRKALGLPFPERAPLTPETVRIIDRGAYRIENLIYQSLPEIYVTANLYVPQQGQGPFPGILFPCGHSVNGKAYELYHSAALGLVQKGYVVLVYDPVGQGERYQYLQEDGTPIEPAPTTEHSLLANPLFLMGRHLMAVRMWDGIRGIDYLLTRKEIDPERIGCTGNSGGGTLTLHLVPLEERIKVAVPAGTVGSPDMELGTGGIGDGEQNLTMLVPYGITHADLMALAYPRPYRLIKESRNGVFRDTRSSFVQARFLYEILGQGEKMSYVETEWPHGYFKAMREPMYFWFGKWFYGREDDHLEPELLLEQEKDLLCSRSGQILNEKGKAVWQWAAGEFRKSFPKRPVPGNEKEFRVFRDTLLSEAKTLLNNPEKSFSPSAVSLGRFEDSGLSVEKLALYSEEDIYLPCLYFKPGQETGRMVILLDSRGKTSDRGALARRLAGSGYGVFAVDLRGLGETAITRKNSYDQSGGFTGQTLGVEAGVAYDGLKLGRSIFAMRVYDILQTVEYLSGKNTEIALIGKSSCGPPALYAAALDQRIKGVLADSSLACFADLVTSRLYNYHFMDFLPGVLQDHDLPQLVGAAAPRTVWILNSLDSQKRLKNLGQTQETYAWSRNLYNNLKNGKSLQLKAYPSQSEREKLYLEWVSTVF